MAGRTGACAGRACRRSPGLASPGCWWDPRCEDAANKGFIYTVYVDQVFRGLGLAAGLVDAAIAAAREAGLPFCYADRGGWERGSAAYLRTHGVPARLASSQRGLLVDGVVRGRGDDGAGSGLIRSPERRADERGRSRCGGCRTARAAVGLGHATTGARGCGSAGRRLMHRSPSILASAR